MDCELDEGAVRRAPTLRAWLLGFAAGAVAILLAAPIFARSASALADITGISASFIGTWLVALVTSPPDLVTSLAAVRLRAYDLAVGNPFGSNAINMVLFVPLDLAHAPGLVLGQLGSEHAIAALTTWRYWLLRSRQSATARWVVSHAGAKQRGDIQAYVAGRGFVFLAAG